ncbi:hypothetical protein PULV_a1695 [Pseudoalteromonas ulvae UL12]|uniref:DUF4007 family protein n=1 Tax=Pseudoalteromonas ulvae TaxID=107327 RepID=UPI00186BAB22|nr:DUF4007 family protein [Pseudoalteromonas ulvae]MBE0364129.1 hypothetical protein [Pseudoalteromonas ulvae UL12]
MKAKFTGHDTFPLRYGWLYKATNFLNNNGKFTSSDETKLRHAVVELGVGKNMVKAIQYWAESTCVVSSNRIANTTEHLVSPKGRFLFGDFESEGHDPFLEHITSVWLVHFWLNFNFKDLTAYRYFFNYSHVQHFEKSKLLDDCFNDAKKLVTNDIGNETTLKKDIDCFLNMYVKKYKGAGKKKGVIDEDHFTSPLSELHLIQDNGAGFYVSNLAERPELPIAVFIYALIEFFNVETSDSNVSTIDFDALLTKPCSPGRIFRLSETGLGQKLDEAQTLTQNGISWVDSLGLRQVKVDKTELTNSLDYLKQYYGKC